MVKVKNLKSKANLSLSFLALEQDKRTYIREAVCCTWCCPALLVSFPLLHKYWCYFIYELLWHGWREICMLHMKGLPGGNSGVQWLLALIAGSQAVSFALGPGKTAPHSTATAPIQTATAPLETAGNHVCCPFLTSHICTNGSKLLGFVATNITEQHMYVYKLRSSETSLPTSIVYLIAPGNNPHPKLTWRGFDVGCLKNSLVWLALLWMFIADMDAPVHPY